MKKTHLRHRLAYLILLILLAAAGCTPAVSSPDADTDEIVQQG
jgi:hypothetical protein